MKTHAQPPEERDKDPAQSSEAEHRDIPLTWVSGSEAELRRLTRAIYHTEPDLFRTQEKFTAIYRAGTTRRRGAYLRGPSDRLVSLCELAFRLNPFVGERWIPHVPDNGQLHRVPTQVVVTIEPPSAHDRAEAILTLMEWLDDKLHDPEKRIRAGILPARASERQDL